VLKSLPGRISTAFGFGGDAEQPQASDGGAVDDGTDDEAAYEDDDGDGSEEGGGSSGVPGDLEEVEFYYEDDKEGINQNAAANADADTHADGDADTDPARSAPLPRAAGAGKVGVASPAPRGARPPAQQPPPDEDSDGLGEIGPPSPTPAPPKQLFLPMNKGVRGAAAPKKPAPPSKPAKKVKVHNIAAGKGKTGAGKVTVAYSKALRAAWDDPSWHPLVPRGTALHLPLPTLPHRSAADMQQRARWFYDCLTLGQKAPHIRATPPTRLLTKYAELKAHAFELFRQTAKLRNRKVSTWTGYSGPWLENHWLDLFIRPVRRTVSRAEYAQLNPAAAAALGANVTQLTIEEPFDFNLFAPAVPLFVQVRIVFCVLCSLPPPLLWHGAAASATRTFGPLRT
jgi:hypothetical protein